MWNSRRGPRPGTSAKLTIAALVLLPWAAGCDLYNPGASVFGVGYLIELWFTAGRSLLGTSLLHIINTF